MIRMILMIPGSLQSSIRTGTLTMEKLPTADHAVGKLLAVLEARSLFDGQWSLLPPIMASLRRAWRTKPMASFSTTKTIHVPLLIKLPKEQRDAC
jgi:hypothetical protein